MGFPRISVITVVYNGEGVLRGTMESVLGQAYLDIEYIVVDGGSSDRSVEIIKEYERVGVGITRWVSERDRGIYDAMNKGMGMATGDYVLFMNAGDWLYDRETLGRLAALATADTDVLYGETMLVDEGRRELGVRSELSAQRLPSELSWRSMRYGMVVCHQSFLMRNKPDRAPLYMLNNLSADIDWVIECLKRSRKIVCAGMIISSYLVGGVSKRRYRRAMLDRYVVLGNHFGIFNNFINHIYIIIRRLWHRWSNRADTTY